MFTPSETKQEVASKLQKILSEVRDRLDPTPFIFFNSLDIF